ncbi:MAG: YegS/Rv2252/BmrU family lipid kinase [Actinomycetales bacterium]|nr:YegS/Rv2252/BmrU family lipid kinase [Actinomycetales bacterium]
MWALVINPVSGQGKGTTVGTYVAGWLTQRKITYTIITGNSAIALTDHLASFIDKNPQCEGVIAIGGDGLLHLILQRVVSSQIPFAIIPAGTGNDFVRTLGWDLENFDAQLEAITSTQPTSIDLGLVDGEWFGAILSTGFDSIVNERANTMNWPKGPMKYNAAIAIELPRFKPRHYEITLDDRTISTEAMLIAVSNGRSYGGGMLVCPNASITDGVFDVMVLHPISKYEFIKVFPRVFAGTHITHPAVEIVRSRSVRIESKAVAYADGERIGQLPVVAECIQGAIKSWIA